MSRLLLALLLACPASAATVRYALVVGADRGDDQDGPLGYAERDASRVADVLTRMGGVSPENLVLLRAPDAAAGEVQDGALVRADAQAAHSTGHLPSRPWCPRSHVRGR